MKKTGIFVGSFDPFTIGHDNIVLRALPLFDRIVIGVVEAQVHKQHSATAEERCKTIAEIYVDEPRIEVKVYCDLAIDFAHREGAKYIIKGVRSVKDFEYEREMAEINRKIGGVETIFLFADPQMASISSSLVRELEHYGQDVSEFLPKPKKV